MYIFPEVTERVKRLRERYRNELPSFDSERVRIVTEYYQKSPYEVPVIRRAKATKLVLSGVPVRIEPEELLVGNTGKYYKGAMLFPEYTGIDWIPQELASGKFDARTLAEAKTYMYPEDRDYLCSVAPYWHDNCVGAMTDVEMPEEYEALCASGALPYNAFRRNETHGHFNANYRKVVEKGFGAIRAEAEEKLNALKANIGGQDAEKWYFYRAVKLCCDGAITFSKRYAEEARRQAETAPEPRRAELLEIAERMDWIMEKPCRNFKDAIQAVLLYHIILAYEGSLLGLTVGRVDQHVGDYLHRDLESGAITEAEAQEYIDCFCLKIAEMIISGPAIFMTSIGAYSDNMRITLGGRKKDGSDASNEATYMVLNTMARLRLHDPNTSLCVHNETPDLLWEAGVETSRRCGGNPTFDNTDLLIQILHNRGLELEDARNFCIVGCVELSGSGCEFANVSGPFSKTFLTIPHIVLQAINDGKNPINGIQCGLHTGYLYEMESFEQVKQAFADQLKYFMDWEHSLDTLTEYVGNRLVPVPIASATVDGCMESGRDMMTGGAKYNSTGNALIGIGTCIDSLAAIRYLVYDKKLCTARELYDAVMTNWEGKEPLRQAAANAPAFGNGDPAVDELASWVSDMYADRINSYTGPRGNYQAGIYSAGMHVAFGQGVPATPNGRKAGEPVSDGASPSQGADRCGPTAVTASILALHPDKYMNGMQFNMKFHPTCIQGEEGTEKLKSFVQAFFSQGGTQVQYNIVSSDTLRKAQESPEDYKDLVVRVAGFSAYFIELVPGLQNDLISRTEIMM